MTENTAQNPVPNPMGTDGFEFVEYTAPDRALLKELFQQLEFRAVARHRSKDVELYRQGGIDFIVNSEPDSFAQDFAKIHGPSICAMRSGSPMRPTPMRARWTSARVRCKTASVPWN